MNRRSIIASLLAMVLAPLGLRVPKPVSLSSNSQVPCWDCGQVPIDEKERQTVALGFNCQTCFDRDTAELLEYSRWGAWVQPRPLTEATLRKAYRVIIEQPMPRPTWP